LLNEEVSITLYPLEQQEKFNKIQQENNELNALFEAQSVAKKELWEFQPIIQTTYLQMHQVDATSN
jgi:hypothetical protein